MGTNLIICNCHHGFALQTKVKKVVHVPAGMLVNNQTNIGSASAVAVTAGEGLIGFGVVTALFFLLCHCSTVKVLQVDSKEEAALLMVSHHVLRFSASVDH